MADRTFTLVFDEQTAVNIVEAFRNDPANLGSIIDEIDNQTEHTDIKFDEDGDACAEFLLRVDGNEDRHTTVLMNEDD